MFNNTVTHRDVPTFLETIKYARQYENTESGTSNRKISVSLVTNYTDDVLAKSLIGLCTSLDIEPTLYVVPYKQYIFWLKDEQSPLYQNGSDITFFSFEYSLYKANEFDSDTTYVDEVIKDITNYVKKTKGIVVLNTITTPSDIQYQRLFKNNTAAVTISTYNERIRALGTAHKNVHILETDPVAQRIGTVYDFRGLFAFDQPFTNEYMYGLSVEWFTYIRSVLGITRKCLVLDLDNTLWGGVVGECGPLGITLGPDYPGNAFIAFQKTLLEYYEQGIILAINSRNNLTDVEEVFKENQYMVLKEKHFACIVANWNTKSENLKLIAKDLNIGLDSLVFIDDDPMNRDLVRTELPEVLVPDFSLKPEAYSQSILNLNAFHTLSHTVEDQDRGKMYAAERKRKEFLSTASSTEEYISTLGIKINIHKNKNDHIPRVAQLTQKTNQFNLTTKRYTEGDVEELLKQGALIYTGDVQDKFGEYGITIIMICRPIDNSTIELDTALMSCRVMGRNIEQDFFRAITDDLINQNFNVMYASYIPTAKNMPAEGYLTDVGAIKQDDDTYLMDLPSIDTDNIKCAVSFET